MLLTLRKIMRIYINWETKNCQIRNISPNNNLAFPINIHNILIFALATISTLGYKNVMTTIINV
jgi:hypothetical protein